MATERIDIVITDSGTKSAAQNIQSVGTAANSSAVSIEKMESALAQSAQAISVLSSELNQARADLSQTRSETNALNNALKTERERADAAGKEMQILNDRINALTAKKKALTPTVNSLNQALVNEIRQLRTLETAMKTDRYKSLTAEMNRLKDATKQTTSALSRQAEVASAINLKGLAGQFIGIAAAIGAVKSAIGAASEFQNLENRLRSTGIEGDGLNSVMGKLKQSADDTRSSFAGTVELYSRLAISSSELGVTQTELIGFTKSLNQAISLSGASAAEAQAGLIQLSQGMASGKLSGDGLRSVLEQLPAVADVISRHMGVTRGELRQLGADGKISANVILDAFKEASSRLDADFKGQVITLDQAFTILGNNVKQAFGTELRSSLEAASGLIITLAENTDELVIVSKSLLVPISAIIALKFATYLKESQIAMQLMTVATANGATGMAAFRNVTRMTIGTIGGLVAALGVAYYGYQKINEAANKRQADEEQAAKRRNTQAADDLVATLKLQRSNLEQQNKLTESWTNERYVRERESRLKQINSLNAEILRAEKQANAARAVENGVSTEDWVSQFKKKVDAAKSISSGKSAKPGKVDELLPATDTKKVLEANYAYSEITTQIDEMFATLGMTDRQLQIHNRLLEYSAKIPQDANSKAMLDTFEQQLNLYYDKVDAIAKQNEVLERQKQILDSIKRTDFNTAMGDLEALSKSGKISPEGRQDYLVSQNQELFAGTIEAQQANIRSYEEMYSRIAMMRESNDISEATASQMRTKVWVMENETRYQNYSTMMGNFAVLSQSTNSHLARIGRASAVTQATIDGVLGVQKALASAPPPVNYALAASVGVAAAANVAKIQGLPMFAFGGDFTVGGTGGTDSQTVAFRATPGEKVTVTTPAQESKAAKDAKAGASQQGAVRIVNVLDPSIVGDYLNTPEGETVFVNFMQRNQDAIKTLVMA